MMPALHRFERDGHRYVIDPATCFCFECDEISWDVLEHYPHESVNRIFHLLQERHPLKELQEVVSELEWLRSAKSILPPPKDPMKDLQVERGLRELSVALPEASAPEKRSWGRKLEPATWDLSVASFAAPFLLARSHQQDNLRLEFVLNAPPPDPAALATLLEQALRLGRASGKKLQVFLHLKNLEAGVDQEEQSRPAPRHPEAESCDGEGSQTLGTASAHRLSVRLPFSSADELVSQCGKLSAFWSASLSKLSKLAAAWPGEEPAELVVLPQQVQFGGVIQTLDAAGFKCIRIDTDALYAGTQSNTAFDAVTRSLNENARYYVARLLEHHYFRVEPFAGLFLQIHHGTPQLRHDPAGTNALALSVAGDIYPSPLLMNRPEFRLGSIRDGKLEEHLLSSFENVGALTTAGCINCWARSLCGGGTAAVHHALSGTIRRPHAPWCEQQRAWLESAIAAFNTLSGAGVNFARLHHNLQGAQRPSLFMLAKAAFRMQLGIRPPEEADAPWLRRWENWNEAAYFTCIENSVLIATQYDREMDALHPRGAERELILIRRDGTPMGLLRLRPERLEGTARLWLYFRNATDYANDGYRRSLGDILKEAGAQQAFKRVITCTAPADRGLPELLLSLGFVEAGKEREALFLHGVYHDLRVFTFGS